MFTSRLLLDLVFVTYLEGRVRKGVERVSAARVALSTARSFLAELLESLLLLQCEELARRVRVRSARAIAKKQDQVVRLELLHLLLLQLKGRSRHLHLLHFLILPRAVRLRPLPPHGPLALGTHLRTAFLVLGGNADIFGLRRLQAGAGGRELGKIAQNLP